MNILSWLMFGLLIGAIANIIDPTPSKGGWIGAILLGILGSMLGGLLGNMVFGIGVNGFNFPSVAIAVLGALLVLFIDRAFRRA